MPSPTTPTHSSFCCSTIEEFCRIACIPFADVPEEEEEEEEEEGEGGRRGDSVGLGYVRFGWIGEWFRFSGYFDCIWMIPFRIHWHGWTNRFGWVLFPLSWTGQGFSESMCSEVCEPDMGNRQCRAETISWASWPSRSNEFACQIRTAASSSR